MRFILCGLLLSDCINKNFKTDKMGFGIRKGMVMSGNTKAIPHPTERSDFNLNSIPVYGYFSRIVKERSSLLILCCFIFSTAILSQEKFDRSFFERIGEADGLSSSHIAHLYEDSGGFIWIGTSNGLYRYDGIQFRTFRSDPQNPNGLSTDFIRRVTGDDTGRIWAVTNDHQVYVYDDPAQGFRNVSLRKDSMNSPLLTCKELHFIPGHGMWMIAREGGLYHINPESEVMAATGLPIALTSQVENLAVDDERLWLIADGVVYRIEKSERSNTKPVIRSYANMRFTSVNAILPDKKGGLWVGGYMSQIVHIHSDMESVTTYFYRKDEPERIIPALDRVNTLCMDEQGQIWAGTNHSGIVVINPKADKQLQLQHRRSDPMSLASHTVTSILKDRAGILWVGQWGGGLQKYLSDRAQFRHFPSISEWSYSITDPVVTTFFEDTDGVIWIGTRNGLNRLAKGTDKVERFFMPNDATTGRQYEILSIQGDVADGRIIWVGTDVGLWQFDQQSGRFTRWRSPDSVGSPLERNIIYYLKKDKNGDLWAVSYWPYRIFQYDPITGLFQQLNPLGKLSISGEPVFIADHQDNIWIGTANQGFFRYRLTEQKLDAMRLHVADSSGFNTNNLGHFYQDRSGTLWVGTESGLYEIPIDAGGQPLPAKRYSDRDGLPSNQIYGILEEDDQLWLSTNRGLVRLNTADRSFVVYSARDGLQADEFSFGACLKSKVSGQLLFGGTNGFNMFNPHSIQKDSLAPLVSITGMEVFGERATREIMFNPIAADRIPAKVTLSPDEKVITISFAALHFADPSRNLFAYKMEGFDKGWRYVGNQPQATYTNIDPGHYRFKVKACNKDGVWNEEGAVLSIRVLPPWWKTWWAFSIYGGLIVAGIYGGLRFERRRQADKSESLRIAELDAVKNRLYTNITHEFRTPLTVITGMADLVEEPAEAKDMIKRNAAGLLHLVNQILDLARLESGRMKLDLVLTDAVSFLQTALEPFRTFAKSKGIDLIFYTESDKLDMDLDTQKLYSIVSNLLSNAIKFSTRGGQILVHLREESGKLQLKVVDQGKGIPPDQINYIFDRFYQGGESKLLPEEGSGIGLTLSRELAELMEGSITVKSEPGKGSEFTLMIPITQNATLSRPSMNWAGMHNPALVISTETPMQTQPDDADLNKPLLLIIEDNNDLVTYFEQILRHQYQIIIAPEGASGIRLAQEFIPDIIISDVMMPGMDGFEVCRTLKRDERTCHIPIILLTALTDMPSRLEGLSVGADAYLAKPFSKEELEIRLVQLRALRMNLQRHYALQLRDPDPEWKEEATSSLDDLFIQKARSILDTHYPDESFGNAQLASRMHISESQLFRKIKALTGQSTALFIRSFRLQKGKEKLETTAMTISEVAYQVGFSDPAYFSRTFAKEFGVSPNAIRNK